MKRIQISVNLELDLRDDEVGAEVDVWIDMDHARGFLQ